jgi:hypothetical protein
MALVARKRRRVMGERKAVIGRSRKKTRSNTKGKSLARIVPSRDSDNAGWCQRTMHYTAATTVGAARWVMA